MGGQIYTDEGVKPLYTFDIDVALHAGMPIQDVRSTSHEVDIHFSNPTSALVDLKKFEAFEGNRDFILEYRLKGKEIQSGVLVYEGEEENFFMAMVQPPERMTREMTLPVNIFSLWMCRAPCMDFHWISRKN